jgi:hypothetical protein
MRKAFASGRPRWWTLQLYMDPWTTKQQCEPVNPVANGGGHRRRRGVVRLALDLYPDRDDEKNRVWLGQLFAVVVLVGRLVVSVDHQEREVLIKPDVDDVAIGGRHLYFPSRARLVVAFALRDYFPPLTYEPQPEPPLN